MSLLANFYMYKTQFLPAAKTLRQLASGNWWVSQLFWRRAETKVGDVFRGNTTTLDERVAFLSSAITWLGF
jgi:hypothetical protein